ncbi:MAG: spore germination protein, partial [Clostridiales bacterium]|nr:spore germination protein [Clostridiales bacterium]
MIFPHRSLSKRKTGTAYESAKTDDTSDNLFDNLDTNINNIKAEIGSGDLIVNLSEANPDRHIRFACVYFDNLISNQVLSGYSAELSEILSSGDNLKTRNPSDFFGLLKNQFASVRKVSQGSTLEDLLDALLSGELVFLIDGYCEFLSVDAYSPEG